MKIQLRILLAILLCMTTTAFSKTYERTLTIRKESVTKVGIPVDYAMTINGTIPGPKLEFTDGDDVIIHLVNEADEETSIHWHGLLLPWDQDGVPYVNTIPVQPGETFTFKFKARQSGTYWYHGHTKLQEQRGVYGSIVIHPKQEKLRTDYDEVIIVSDWINTHPIAVLGNLKKGEYYSWAKGQVPNWWDALAEGATKDFWALRVKRMEGMDFGDVAYDGFLTNGKEKNRMLENIRPGETVRLRIINAGASTYFNLQLGQQKLNVISADGQDVKPVLVDRIFIPIAESYDVIFTMPEGDKAYEFRATSQDASGHSSMIIGGGSEIEYATDLKTPSLYKMQMNMGMGSMDMKKDKDMGDMTDMDDPMPMPMPKKVKTLTYKMLKSETKTSFSKDLPVMNFKLVLGGDMRRYTWWINGKMINEDTYIDIKEGSVIRFNLENKTMMHHPMHLHGHFFRVLFGKNDYAPLKHTVNVPPGGKVTMEFLANEPGEWLFHCHNLYHFKAGMGRIVRYIDFKRPVVNLPNGKTASEMIEKWAGSMETLYPVNEISLTTAGIEYDFRFNGGKYEIQFEGTMDEYKLKELEGQMYIKYYLSRFGSVFAGADYTYNNGQLIVGGSYIIPLDFELVGYLTQDKKAVFEVVKREQLTKRLAVEVDMGVEQLLNGNYDTNVEAGIKFQYRLGQNISLEAGYTNDNLFSSESNVMGGQSNPKAGRTYRAGVNWRF